MSPTTSARASRGAAPAATAPGRPAGPVPGTAPRPEVTGRQGAGSRPVPTLAGELRGSALLFALALAVTVGGAAVARVLAGLAP